MLERKKQGDSLSSGGSLAASFRRKMHIGYFYDAVGRRRGRLAVFRDISSEKGAYFASSESGHFCKKTAPFSKIDHNFSDFGVEKRRYLK